MQDEFIQSHEAAEDILRSAAPGARVVVNRVPSTVGSDRTRAYRVELERLGRQPIVTTGSYVLGQVTARTLFTNVQHEINRVLREAGI